MASHITVLLYVALYFFSALYSALHKVPIVGLYLWAFEKVLWASIQAVFYAYDVWRNLKKTAVTVLLFSLWPIILPVAVIDSFIYAVRVQCAAKSASGNAGARRSWPSFVHSMAGDGQVTTVTELLVFLLLEFPIAVLRKVTMAFKTLTMKTLDLMLLPYLLPLRILKMAFKCIVRSFFGDLTDETETTNREPNDNEPETLNPEESEQVPRAGSVNNDGACCCRCRCSNDDLSVVTQKGTENPGDNNADLWRRIELHEEYYMNILLKMQSDFDRKLPIVEEKLTRLEDTADRANNAFERLSNGLDNALMLIEAAVNRGNGRQDLGDRDGAMAGPSGNGGANGESAGLGRARSSSHSAITGM